MILPITYGSLRSGGELNSTMVGINGPTRIGHVLVMPGDVVLGKEGGVIFIPPQFAEKVVKTSEIVHLRDMFGHQAAPGRESTPRDKSMRDGRNQSNAISRSGSRKTESICRCRRSRWRKF